MIGATLLTGGGLGTADFGLGVFFEGGRISFSCNRRNMKIATKERSGKFGMLQRD